MAQKALRERAASVMKEEFVELVGELQNKKLVDERYFKPTMCLG